MIVLALLLGAQPDYCIESPYGIGTRDKKPFICSRAFEPSTAQNASAAQKAGGPSLNWPGRTATYRLSSTGTRDIAGTQELNVIRRGFATWTEVQGASFTIVDGGLTQSERIGFDFRRLEQNDNIVMFQTDWPHDAQIIGLTTATFNAQTGEIFDADIELNDEYYDFTIGDEDVQTDLLNTVTHEIGHFLGFDHTDKDGSTIDEECASTATMSKTSSLGETSKRVLAGTDELGMKFVYPANGPIGFCNPPQDEPGPAPTIRQIAGSLGQGCSQSAPSLFLLLALGLLRRRRC